MQQYHFLSSCTSKPKTLADLEIGDAFICFPGDGDDSGHGGFQGSARLLVKIKPPTPASYYTFAPYEHPDQHSFLPLTCPIIKVFGVPQLIT